MLTLIAGFLTLGSGAYAASWQTVDEHVARGRTDTFAMDLVQDPHGRLVAVGCDDCEGVNSHWLVRISEDLGQTWVVADDYARSPSVGAFARVVTTDSAGNLYVAGSEIDSAGYKKWIVRRSMDHGHSWRTVDAFSAALFSRSIPSSIRVLANGDLLVTGMAALYDTDERRLLTRLGRNGGDSWTTVQNSKVGENDDSPEIFKGSSAEDAGGGLYVSGYEGEGPTGFHATVRKSADHGAHWSIVDSFFPPDVQKCGAGAMLHDPETDALYVVVTCVSDNDERWFVRGSFDRGKTWETLDRYLPAGANKTEPIEISRAGDGTLLVLGSETPKSATSHYILRSSRDGGLTWQTRHLAFPGVKYQFYAEPTRVVVAQGGELLVPSSFRSETNYSNVFWSVLKSADQGASWEPLDRFQQIREIATVPSRVFSLPEGGLLAGGVARSRATNGWLIRRSMDQGQSWVDVDWIDTDDLGTRVADFTRTTDGLFAAGSLGLDGVLRRSLDGGASWETIARFKRSPVKSIVSDATGALYITCSRNSAWITSRSSDGGTTWNPVDVVDSAESPVFNIYTPERMATDGRGRIYVAGSHFNADTGISDWAVRRSEDGGWHWAWAELFQEHGRAGANDVTVDASTGDVYVAGFNSLASGNEWMVRKSSDHGKTWAAVDRFGAKEHGRATALWAGNGRVLAAGKTDAFLGEITDLELWTVRESRDGGKSWRIVDRSLKPGERVSPSSLAIDTLGSIFAAGTWSPGNERPSHWILRKLK